MIGLWYEFKSLGLGIRDQGLGLRIMSLRFGFKSFEFWDLWLGIKGLRFLFEVNLGVGYIVQGLYLDLI